MSVFSAPSPIPPFRASPGLLPPEYRALVIGINYVSSNDSDYLLPLHGSVNGAKDIKEILEGVYHYRKVDVVLMTDEEENRGTDRWPSRANILRAIDNLVRNASSEDAFVFYYAGHCGQKTLMIDSVDVKHKYIITRDGKKILENTLHKHLVNPLPMGSRLRAIFDSCYSGQLLALSYYRCHVFLRTRCQSQSKSLRICRHIGGSLRRNTEPGQLRTRVALSHFRRLSSIVTVTLAITCLKSLQPKRSKKGRKAAKESVPPTPTTTCHLCNRMHDMSKVPDVISLAPWSEDQRTYEDRRRKGKSVTTKLTKILRKNPNISLGDLNQQLNWSLSKLAFKRVRTVTSVFRIFAGMVSPERRMKLEKKYKAQGLFDFGEVKAHFGSLQPLRLEDRFIVMRGGKGDTRAREEGSVVNSRNYCVQRAAQPTFRGPGQMMKLTRRASASF